MEMLEIERELSGPDRQAALRRHDAVLVGLAGRLDAVLAAGLPPDEYDRCTALAEAVTVARKLLRLQVRSNA